jgi:hypothetical protein
MALVIAVFYLLQVEFNCILLRNDIELHTADAGLGHDRAICGRYF